MNHRLKKKRDFQDLFEKLNRKKNTTKKNNWDTIQTKILKTT